MVTPRTVYYLLRLHKPAGALLLFFPCAMGLALAQYTEYFLYLLFFVGSFALRSAGCIINDIFDAPLDAHVARTKDRPLASGAISRFAALCILFILCLIGCGILYYFPWSAIKLALAVVPLIVLYPLAKRAASCRSRTEPPAFANAATLAFVAESACIAYGVGATG